MEEKVLIIANNSGGLYQFRKELIEELIAKGCQVYASIPQDDFWEELSDMGLKMVKTNIDRRGMNPVKDLSLILAYYRLISKIKPDKIITYTIKPNLYGGIIAALKKVPYAINITGLGTAFQKEGLLKNVIIQLYKWACKRAKVIFFENSGNAKLFLDENLANKEQIIVLNGAGVNLDKFNYVEYPENSQETRFLFMGRVMKEKGIEELFSSIERLHKENPSIVLDVLGHMEEGYDDRISELTRQGAVNYHGHQTDVRPFIENCHCFVLPSYHEGMANTNLESAAMGRPVITSKIPGCMEAVVEGQSGFLCETQNVDDLYQQMKRFITLPYQEKVAMGQAGRRHMENVFDKKKVVQQTVAELLK